MKPLSIAMRSLWGPSAGEERKSVRIFTEEAAFETAIDNTQLLVQSFDSLKVDLNVGPLSLEHVVVNTAFKAVFGTDKSDFVSDGKRAIVWLQSASGDITFTFYKPVNVFAIDIKDLGNHEPATLSFKIDDGRFQEVFIQAKGGPGNLRFLGLFSNNGSFSKVTFTNSVANDGIGFDRLQCGIVALGTRLRLATSRPVIEGRGGLNVTAK